MGNAYDKIKIPEVTKPTHTGRSAKYGEVKKEVDNQGIRLLLGAAFFFMSCIALVLLFSIHF